MSAVAGLLSIAAPAAIIIQQRASARELQAAFDEERTARVAAEDMAGFVIDLVENADPNVQKPGAAVKQILSRGVERLDERLGPYPTRHAQVQKVLGRIHGSLGLFPEAHALLDESVATLESTHTDASQRHGVGDRRTREALGHLVESRGARARVRELSGDLAGAFEDRRSLEAELSVLWPDDPWRELYARAEWMRLSAYAPEGAFGSKAPPDDLAVLEAIRAAAEATEASTSAGESYRIATLGWLGSQLVRLGQVSTDRTQARAWTEEGRDSLRSALARVENSSEVGSLDHADMHNALGLALKRLGDAKGAEAHYLASLEILNERLSPDNQRLAVASVNMASFLNTQGKPAEAIEPMRQGYEILKNARGPEDPDVVGVFGSLAGVRYHAGDHEGLADMLTEVIALQAKVLSPRHRFLAASYERRGILRAKEGDVDAARADLHESLERYREFLAEDSAPCARVEGALASLQAAEEGADAADDR
ncbi:MAG: tetratricopeptide repeat protein [Planctomycetota bacterium]